MHGFQRGRFMSQTSMILHHLKREGSITPLDALSRYGIFRLSARIQELRNKGHHIETELIDLPSHKHCARYKLIQKPVQKFFQFQSSELEFSK